MASINSRKKFRPQAFFHIYNRGVNKNNIFFDEIDYRIFRNLAKMLISKYYKNTLHISGFCLMPNHYHFLIFQKDIKSISHFIHRLQVRFSLYINKKYNRTGTLYQGVYRGSYVSASKFAKTKDYILNNPQEANLTNWSHVGETL